MLFKTSRSFSTYWLIRTLMLADEIDLMGGHELMLVWTH
jgi:hypothetical protein